MADQGHGTIDCMAERLDLKKPSVQELSRRCSTVSQTIKPRNNPRSVYVHDFQRLSQSCNINVHCDIYQTLDFAMAFKGLTVVMLSDPPQETQVSIQKSERPFEYSSPSPSPTSTEKERSLEDVEELPIPSDITEEKVFVQDDIWEPPNTKVVSKRPYNSCNNLNATNPEFYRCKHCRHTSWDAVVLEN